MMIFLFLAFGVLFLVCDLLTHHVPNLWLISGIICGIAMTGNWIAMLVMMLLGIALAYPKKKQKYLEIKDVFDSVQRERALRHCAFRGGDVKMLMFCGAFLGFKAVAVLILAMLVLTVYRQITRKHGRIAFAPFLMPSALLFFIL